MTQAEQQNGRNGVEGRGSGWLKTAFQAASTYLFPVAFKRNKYTLFEPDVYGTIKKLAIAFMASAGMQMGVTLTLPTAEDYLRDNNIDPSVAAELSNNKIRILPHNLHGEMFAYTRLPTAAGLYLGYLQNQMWDNMAAFAFTDNILPYWTQNYAVLLKGSVSPERLFSGVIPKTYLENLPITQHELEVMVALHEFRHTHGDNMPTRRDEPDELYRIMMGEADADVVGISKAADILDKPELIKVWLYFRALNFNVDDPHNIALYLDAAIAGEALPTALEMDLANHETTLLLLKYYNDFTGSDFEKSYKAIKCALEQEGDEMSPSTKRRMELCVEAVEYFAPSLIEKNRSWRLERNAGRGAMPALVPEIW